jgi:hypothetical protein
MFVTTSPEQIHWNESVSALSFATRCRTVDLKGNAVAGLEAELGAAHKKIAELTAALKPKK